MEAPHSAGLDFTGFPQTPPLHAASLTLRRWLAAVCSHGLWIIYLPYSSCLLVSIANIHFHLASGSHNTRVLKHFFDPPSLGFMLSRWDLYVSVCEQQNTEDKTTSLPSPVMFTTIRGCDMELQLGAYRRQSWKQAEMFERKEKKGEMGEEKREREAGEGSKMRRQAEAKPKHQPGRRERGWQLLKVWGQSQGNPKHNGRAL